MKIKNTLKAVAVAVLIVPIAVALTGCGKTTKDVNWTFWKKAPAVAVADPRAEYEAIINGYIAEIAGLNNQVLSLHSQISLLTANNGDHAQTILELNAQIVALQNQIETLQGQIALLTADMGISAQTIILLNAQIAELNEQIEQLYELLGQEPFETPTDERFNEIASVDLTATNYTAKQVVNPYTTYQTVYNNNLAYDAVRFTMEWTDAMFYPSSTTASFWGNVADLEGILSHRVQLTDANNTTRIFLIYIGKLADGYIVYVRSTSSNLYDFVMEWNIPRAAKGIELVFAGGDLELRCGNNTLTQSTDAVPLDLGAITAIAYQASVSMQHGVIDRMATISILEYRE